MGQTIAEKIFARASGKHDARAGDFVTGKIDLHYNLEAGLVEVHNKVVQAGLPEGLPGVADPDKLAMMLGDHSGCHANSGEAGNIKLARELAKRYGIVKLYEVNNGIAHAVVPEEGLARPGMLICGKDSHTTTCGAVNALATPVSAVETAWIYLTGELWFRVPESVKVVCNGRLQDGVEAKDVFLHVIGKYSPSMGQYKSVEWKGSVIETMSMDGRFTLACQSIELGAKCAPFDPDQTCLDYVASTPHGNDAFWPTIADNDAEYVSIYEEDYSDLIPQVAVPHGFDVIEPVTAVEGTKIDLCNIGACANCRDEDVAMAARIVKGKKVKARTVLCPGTWKVYRRAIESGAMATLVDAGVMVMAPSCLPCHGNAALADGEVAIGATTRNFRGRYGSRDAEIYLGSVATSAASAVMGEITDPRKLL